MASWYHIQDDFHREHDNWWRKFVKGLNNAFNPNHAWFDYDEWDKTSGNFSGILDDVANLATNVSDTISKVFGDSRTLESLIARYTGAEQTGAEREAQEFNAGEAQKSRDFTEYMARNKYSMETQSMQDAGLNPAAIYGGGSLVPTAANGATASSPHTGSLDLFAALATMMRMPSEIKKMQAETEKSYKEGDAALITAKANAQNAGTNERQAAVAEARVQIERSLAQSNIKVNDETINQMAANVAYINEQRNYISKNWEVAEKNAEAHLRQAGASEQMAKAAATQAVAALRQADAAVQNAATNDYLAGYQSDLMYSQTALNELLRNEKSEVLKYLPQELQEKINVMRSLGYYYNQQGALCDRQGKVLDSQVARNYVGVATDITRALCQIAGTVMTGGAGGALVSAGGYVSDNEVIGLGGYQ